MALLRNLEQSLSGLFEGTFGRVFRTEVRPTEIARKLAREMEINKRVSLSRTYAPTDYLVYLSPDDRARYAGVEHSIAEELGAYLLEHARRERLVLVRRPLVEFRTDQRLHLGEFGIEARTAPISPEEAPPRAEPVLEPERPAPAPRPAATPDPHFPPPAPDDPEFRPAVPLGQPDPESEPADAGPLADEPAYEDPYAGDPFSPGDASQPDDFAWQDDAALRYADAAPELEPEPVADEPEVWHPEYDEEPALSGPDQSPGDADWLDPVEDWLPQAAAEAPEAPAAPEPPHAPVPPPAPLQPIAGGTPWIDPTLARGPQRPPLAPPVVPPRRRADTVLLIDGTPHELRGDRVVLGRSRTADIVVSDPSVSRQHLELRHDDRGWYAVDLGSTNGSQVDDTPVSEPRRLDKGMRIKLGHAAAIIEVR